VSSQPAGLPAASRRRLPEPERRQRTTHAIAAAAAAHTSTERRRALDLLVVANLAIAEGVAARFARRGIEQEDLEQVAFMALVKASRRFDPTRDRDFLAFAVPTITGEVKRHFRDLGWVVRPPRRLQELQSRVLRRRTGLAQELGREPTPAELAGDLGEVEGDVVEVLAIAGCFRPVSIDTPSPDGTTSLVDRLVQQPPTALEGVETRAELAYAMRELTERERRILALRFDDDLNQAEIGQRFGLSQTQVSRILSTAFAKLRPHLTPPDGRAA
jgi:RNA polymerase sigma-B factor